MADLTIHRFSTASFATHPGQWLAEGRTRSATSQLKPPSPACCDTVQLTDQVQSELLGGSWCDGWSQC